MPGLGIEELVVAASIRSGRTNGAFIEICKRKRRTWNNRSGFVLHGSDNGSLDGLGEASTPPGKAQ